MAEDGNEYIKQAGIRENRSTAGSAAAEAHNEDVIPHDDLY